jgi:hypothetical protein
MEKVEVQKRETSGVNSGVFSFSKLKISKNIVEKIRK